MRGIRQIPESLSTARFLPAPAVGAMRYTMQQLPIVRPGKKCPDFPALSLSLSLSLSQSLFLFFPRPLCSLPQPPGTCPQPPSQRNSGTVVLSGPDLVAEG
jgi:hypothetical protein